MHNTTHREQTLKKYQLALQVFKQNLSFTDYKELKAQELIAGHRLGAQFLTVLIRNGHLIKLKNGWYKLSATFATLTPMEVADLVSEYTYSKADVVYSGAAEPEIQIHPLELSMAPVASDQLEEQTLAREITGSRVMGNGQLSFDMPVPLSKQEIRAQLVQKMSELQNLIDQL